MADLDEAYNFFIKHWKKGGIGAILFGVIYYSFPLLSNLATGNSANVYTPNNSNTTNIQVVASPVSHYSENKCTSSDFTDIKTRWDAQSYKSSANGFLCPKKSSNYLAPDIWLTENVPVNFGNISFKAEIRPEAKASVYPGLILSLGQDPQLFRFLVNDGGGQSVAFERSVFASGAFEFKREIPAKQLDDPIQIGTPINITVQAILSKSNTASFIFILEYISSVSGRQVTNQFSYDIDLPYTNPSDKDTMTRFGFSVFKGNCIKPISFSACTR